MPVLISGSQFDMPWVLHFCSFCLHRQISVVNLLKNHCALCFFRRLVLWKKKSTDKFCWFLLGHPAAMAKLGEKMGSQRDWWMDSEWPEDLTQRTLLQVQVSPYAKCWVVVSRYPTVGVSWFPSTVLVSLLEKLHTADTHTGHDLPGLSSEVFLDG